MKLAMPESDEQSEMSFLPSRVWLIDRSQPLVDQWRRTFADCPAVESLAGDYFQRPADGMVSPANSFGIMDGGLDLAIRDELGFTVERRIQDVIVAEHHNELPVGCAEIVETGDRRWPYMIAAPTMRIPEPVSNSLNAYLAFRAVLLAVKNFNRAHNRRVIDSIVCCGLATGIGRMSAAKCAGQMRAAYGMMNGPAHTPSFRQIHMFHRDLLLL